MRIEIPKKVLDEIKRRLEKSASDEVVLEFEICPEPPEPEEPKVHRTEDTDYLPYEDAFPEQ